MKYRDNICKFISDQSKESLKTTAFVLETDLNRISNEKVLKDNALHIVISGRGTLVTDAVKKQLKPGYVFFTFADGSYKVEDAKDMAYMYINFSGSRSDELFKRFGITPSSCVFEGHEGLLSLWQSAIVMANTKNSDLISEGVLLYTLGEMTPFEKNKEQELMGAVLKYVQNNFSDCELSLARLAQKLGYNEKYLSRIFKDDMKVNFSAYLTNLRIQHAIFLIEQGVTAVKNIAILSGYKDPFYFSKVFKAVVGKSPREYMKK